VGFNFVYRYENLMELELAFAFRTQGILSRDFIRLIAVLRGQLRPMFRRAYLERDKGLGSPKRISLEDVNALEGRSAPRNSIRPPRPAYGTYLDLALSYMPGGVLAVRKCQLLGPEEAIWAFTDWPAPIDWPDLNVSA